MTDDVVEQLRKRLFEISTALGDLADDDFAGKHTLNTEADTLRLQLDGLVDDDPEKLREWANRAGRKGAHTQDLEALKAMAQRMESGGSPGA